MVGAEADCDQSDRMLRRREVYSSTRHDVARDEATSENEIGTRFAIGIDEEESNESK